MGLDRWVRGALGGSSAQRLTGHPLVRNRVTRRARTAGMQLGDVAVILRSGLFDQEWYQEQTGRTFATAKAAVADYVRTGRRAGLSPHPLFEASWVDPARWAVARRDPYAEFLRSASSSARSPHPCFSPMAWLARHPEAAATPFGAYGHFLDHASGGGGGGGTVEMTPDPALFATTSLTWQEFRRRSWEQVRAWWRERSVVDAPRVTAEHDWEADAAFVRRWAAETPRATGDGPLVSVVMPVRNRPVAVRRAIESVQAQTLDDWELLVVDDGSDDETPEVVAAYADQDPRVVLLRSEHGGVSAARNVAARAARGRYLAWLDSDNAWTPHFLATALAAVEAGGDRAAYAEAELRSPSGTRYRSLDGGLDHLAHRNHVDLNVLVADRDLVSEIGGFDESLRRTVDYDLAWRMAQRAPLRHLPFVGVVYDEDDASDRVTTRELKSWRDVVRNKHVVDWAALDEGVDERLESRTSVVVAARTGWQAAWASASAALDAVGTADDVELVVVDSALGRGEATVLRWLVELGSAQACADGRRGVARVGRLGTTGHTALTWNVGLGLSSGDVVAFLDEGVRPSAGWVGPLRQALEQPGVGLVQPLVLSAGGVVASAGGLFTDTDVLPCRFLEGCTLDDADRLSGLVQVGCVDGPAVAGRARDLVAARGFTCLYVNGWEAADLSLRMLRSSGVSSVVAPSSTVTAWRAERGQDANEPANRRLFCDTWRDQVPPPDQEPWRAVGLTVVRHEAGPTVDEAEPRRPWPVLARVVGPATTPAPRLRWAIKTAVPFGSDAHRWGDLHFARALADALRRLGQDVSVDYRGGLDRPTAGLDDVVVALRGRVAVPVHPGTTHILWVISHPDLVGEDELRSASLVFAASAPWAERTSRAMGRLVTPLLQATDPERFRPDVAQADSGESVIFVGNSRNVFRPVVRHLVTAGVPVAVYGGRWEQFIDSGHLRADHLDNADLARYYRSAGVVLNDHWDGMREAGFMSNRLFDATAAAARVISDDVPGTEVFGGLVQTFRDDADLVDLVGRYADAFPSEEERLLVSDRIRREHSFDARARTLLDAALAARNPTT